MNRQSAKVFAAIVVACFLVATRASAQFAVPAPAKPDGATLFSRQCGTCHIATAEGGPRQGPSLYGVFGRKAGSVAGFAYTGAYAESGIVWDAQTLDTYLTNPQAMIKGTVMAYRQADPAIRQTIIAWLKDQH